MRIFIRIQFAFESQLTMRKKPQQKRSQQLVDSLVEATAKSLVKRGFEGITTHHIAETAGVSVGSLYQYFDSKEALIEALLEKLGKEISNSLIHLPMEEEGDLRTNVGLIVRFGFMLLNSRDGLFLELVRNWHSIPTDDLMDQLEKTFMDLSRVYFLKHYHDSPIEDLHVRIYIIANSVMFTMVRYLGQDNTLISEQEVAEGLIEMVVGYLQSPTILV